MTEKKTSEAQIRASKKWNQKNKDHKRIKDNRSAGIRFLKRYANLEDLDEFQELINEKRKELENQ